MNSSINLVLDGNNILFRAYHVVKNKRLVDNIDASSIDHWFRMIKGYMDTFKPTDVYVTWDKKINKCGKNFRKELVDYKGTREIDETVMVRIHDTTNLIIEICNNLGIKTVLPYDLEGDDVIYFLVKKLEGDKVVVSGDKDLFQLVSHDTKVFYTNKNVLIDLDNFEEVVGIPIENYIDYKCILGDASDNIIGLKRYGPVKAKKLAIEQNWESLDEEQIKILELNRILIDLSFGPKNNSDEWESYEKQLLTEVSMDSVALQDICKSYDLGVVRGQIPFWKEFNMHKEFENLFF